MRVSCDRGRRDEKANPVRVDAGLPRSLKQISHTLLVSSGERNIVHGRLQIEDEVFSVKVPDKLRKNEEDQEEDGVGE
jgi:hypothetical protein